MNSNYIQFDTLWEYLCPIMKQIDDLKHETQKLRLLVGQLQQTVNLLEKQRAYSQPNPRNSVSHPLVLSASALKSLMKDLRAANRPPLPDDVLRIVFVHCLPRGSEAVMKAHEAPLVFGRVCKTWRRVAWSTQELWDTFQVEIPYLTHRPLGDLTLLCDAFVEGIRGWMKRSGTRPLCISLKDKHPLDWCLNALDGQRTQALQCFIKEISTESARWKSIRLELPGGVIRKYLAVESLRLLALESLEVRNSSLEWVSSQVAPLELTALLGDNHDTVGCHPIMIASSARLRSLHIGDPTMACPTNTLTSQNQFSFSKLVWDSLLDLSIGTEHSTLGSIKISDAHGILQYLADSGTQLRRCRMALRSDESLIDRQACLPSLQEIAITLLVGEPLFQDTHHPTPTDHRLSHFFSHLKCTSLHSFSYQADMESVLPFISFLQGAQGLEKLHLYSVQLQQGREAIRRWKECLRICPCVKELHVSTMLSEYYFNMNSLLPRLEILVLDCTPPMDRTQLFQTYVKNRSVSEPVLRRIMEKERHRRLAGRLGLVWSLCHSSLENSHGALQLKEARLRVSERFRDEVLDCLAASIARGLCLTFKEDYYDIPPPVESPPSREGLWSSTDDIV